MVLEGGVNIPPGGVPEEGKSIEIPAWTDSEGKNWPASRLWVKGYGKRKRLIRDPVPSAWHTGVNPIQGIKLGNGMEGVSQEIANGQERGFRPGKATCLVCTNPIFEGVFSCGICGFWPNAAAIEYGRCLYIEEGNKGPGWYGRYHGQYGEEEMCTHTWKFVSGFNKQVKSHNFDKEHGILSTDRHWPLPCAVVDRI